MYTNQSSPEGGQVCNTVYYKCTYRHIRWNCCNPGRDLQTIPVEPNICERGMAVKLKNSPSEVSFTCSEHILSTHSGNDGVHSLHYICQKWIQLIANALASTLNSDSGRGWIRSVDILDTALQKPHRYPRGNLSFRAFSATTMGVVFLSRTHLYLC